MKSNCSIFHPRQKTVPALHVSMVFYKTLMMKFLNLSRNPLLCITFLTNYLYGSLSPLSLLLPILSITDMENSPCFLFVVHLLYLKLLDSSSQEFHRPFFFLLLHINCSLVFLSPGICLHLTAPIGIFPVSK